MSNNKIDWVDTPDVEEIGSIRIHTSWYYDETPDHSYLGSAVDKPTKDVYYDRKIGALMGPEVTVQRTFSKREIGLHEIDTRQFYEFIPVTKNWGEELETIDGMVWMTKFESLRSDKRVKVLPHIGEQWTEESEAKFLAYIESYFQDEDDYPDIMNTDTDDQEIEWECLEVFPDGSARYEADIPEVLDNSFSWGVGRNEYRYIQGFQHLPKSWGDVSAMEKSEMVKYCMQDVRRLHGLFNNSWCYVGCNVEVYVDSYEIGTAALWGIESDSEEYLQTVYKEVREEALSGAKSELDKLGERVEELKASYTAATLSLENHLAEEKEEND